MDLKQFISVVVICAMEPFNIKIGYGENEVTLTILPTNEGYYKVIYYGGILGAVHYELDCWSVVPADKVIAGDLPLYKHDLMNTDRLDIVLDEPTVTKIGEEIDDYQ